jgi:hypothetical protein
MNHRDGHAQRVVTDEPVAAYQRDGAVCLRGLLSRDEVALLREGIFESPLAAAAARLMRRTSARLFHDHMLTKEPGTHVEGRNNVSFWIVGAAMELPLFPVVWPRST